MKEHKKEKNMFKLTWYVSVTILKGMEVVHEFFYRDLKGLKQASVFKEPVGDLTHKIKLSECLCVTNTLQVGMFQ